MYVNDRVWERRAVLRAASVGFASLAGAALLGCGAKGGNATNVAGNVPAAIGTGTGTGKSVLPLTAPVVQGAKKPGGSFTQTAGATTFKQHDSHTALGPQEWHIISDKLVELDAITAALQPSIAASWEVADPKGLTLTMKLHPDLRMHNRAPWNGRNFNAEDVAWNLERNSALYAERLKLPKSAFQRASMTANLVKAEAVDPLTVKITLSAPNSAFFNGLGDTRMMLMPKEMDDIGFKDPLKFGSMGPFEITEVKTDLRERYTKFGGYWRTGEPTFDDFVRQSIPDLTSTEAAFINGEIQTLSVLPADLTTVQQRKPDANLYTWIDSNWDHLRFSVEYAPFKDFRVRQALHLATDYADISNNYYGPGWAYQAALCPGFPEAWSPDKIKSLPGYNPDTKEKDRADAMKLLEAAGYPNGKGLDFDVIFQNPSEVHRGNATRFQGQMQGVFSDITIKLHPFADSASFAPVQSKGDFEMVSYVITANPDAVPEMIAQYHTIDDSGGGSRNYGHFSNKDLDTLIEKAQAELDRNARTKLLDTFQQKWVDEWRPMLVLHANPVRTFMQRDVAGFDKSAGTWHGYANYTRVREWFYVSK